MLGKNLILTTFCGALFISGFANDWKKVSIESFINSDHYLLSNGQQVQLADIQGLDWIFPSVAERCLTESSKILLKNLLESQAIKIKTAPDQLPGTPVWRVVLKFGSQDLGAFLLSKGLAVVENPGNKTYLAAQKSAQAKQVGRWGQCDPHLNIKKWEKKHGRTAWFWQRYHPSLRGTGVGKVIAVLPGNILKLKSGLQLHLENLRLPAVDSKNMAEQCFLEESRKYLEHLVLGKKVLWLTGKTMNLYNFKTLSRQVYLPKTRWRPEIWLNRKLIIDGYGRGLANLSVYEDWENPQGAWGKCLKPFADNL